MQIIGTKTVYAKKCTGSSMDWAHEMLEDVPDGTLFLADEYGSARGQHGRVWRLTDGQLILTFVLKPDKSTELNFLNMAIANGVIEALKPYGASIKYPNDFMLDGKKAGGMLVEIVWSGEELKGIVVGIAINCNNSFDEQDELFEIATSIYDATGKCVDIDRLRETLLVALDKWYQDWRSGRTDDIFSVWKNNQG